MAFINRDNDTDNNAKRNDFEWEIVGWSKDKRHSNNMWKSPFSDSSAQNDADVNQMHCDLKK